MLTIVAILMAAVAAQAQSNAKATIKAAEVVIKKYSPKYVEPITDEFCEKFKKNPEVMVGIADAYLYKQRDTLRAYKYLRQALEADSKYAPAYLLGGEIEESERDTAKAVEWYNRGITAAPTDPACYLAYAKLMSMKNPAAAQQRIEELLAHAPTFPVDLELAKMYERVADNMTEDNEERRQTYNKSIEYYSKCDLNIIPKSKLLSYCIMLYSNSKDYDKTVEVARFGVEKFAPANAEFNRVGMMANFGRQNWQDAVSFGESLFKADSLIPKLDDYWNLSRAYKNIKKYPEAIAVANNLISNDTMPEESKLMVHQLIAQCHQETGNWDGAMQEYNYYMGKQRESGNLSAYDLNVFASMYMNQSEELNGEDKMQAYRNADAVFAEMAEKFPDRMGLALYQRIRLNWLLEQGDYDKALAKPLAEQLISVTMAKGERGEADNARLLFCYKYLSQYYINIKKSDKKTAKLYFMKILEIEPDNENAQKAVNILK